MQVNDDTLALLTGAPRKPSRQMQDSMSSDYIEEPVSAPGCDTIHPIHPAQEHEENTSMSNSAQRITTLDGLSNILYLRGRLQQMGAIFSRSGELKMYGNPSSKDEFEQMLRLGPMYAEQWNLFFVNGQTTDVDDTIEMWSDLRTLKKMLINNGAVFGLAHLRLSEGISDSKMLRLGQIYDELRKQWLAMKALRLPKYDDAGREVPSNDAPEADSGCGFGNDTDDDTNNFEPELERCCDNTGRDHEEPNNGVPCNIGWRFSDDIDTAPNSSILQDLKDDNPGEQGKYVPEDKGITLSSGHALNRNLIYPASNGAFASQLNVQENNEPSLTISGKMNTSNMTIQEALLMSPSDNLGDEADRIEADIVETNLQNGLQAKNGKKKKPRFHNWVRRVFCRE